MLALYYLLKSAKEKHRESDNYSTYFYEPSRLNSDNLYSKCRVCLRDGTIPIFGSDSITDISDALKRFADIDVCEDDEHPKYLCKTCHKFLRGAILFRNKAKESEKALKRSVKQESHEDQFQDTNDHSDNNDDENTLETKEEKWSKVDLRAVKREKNSLPNTPKVNCPVCNKLINHSYYKVHMTLHDPDHKKFVCEVCGKSFRLRCAYYNHSLRHRSDFPYKCQFCPYKGRYRELLKTHMRTHTGDYQYMCTECPARFLFKSNLNSHMLKHKEPQFKCDACKRAFHTKLFLQRHFEADHLGIKNHVCNICGKAFGYRNAMMKHQRHVHKREKYLYGRMPSYLKDEGRKES